MTAPLRLGSVCTGYGGLDMAVAQVLDVETAWVADPDPGAAAILTHHWPTVPNLGDITALDWSTVPAVDVVCGGYPCQPFSLAGKKKGTADDRHLWPYIARALRVLRPRLAIFENVDHHLRLGFGTVLADLAEIGFDAEWCLVRADEVGAAHRRNRLIFFAWPADAGRPRLQGHRVPGATAERGRAAQDTDRTASGERWLAAPGQAEGGRARADARGRGRAPATDTPRDGRHERRPGPARQQGRPKAALGDRAHVDWGDYGPAIDRWARILGRPAPAPTEPGRTGDRLSPRFVEWLMGLDEGHVTAVPGLTRNQMLKALGNGVVRQQAIAALDILLDRIGVAA